MQRDRLLFSLLFAVATTAAACGGTQDSLGSSSGNLSARGDGGTGDVDDDSDEATDEATRGDGGHHGKGKKHIKGHHHRGVGHEHGDGGFGKCDRDDDSASDESGHGDGPRVEHDGGVRGPGPGPGRGPKGGDADK